MNKINIKLILPFLAGFSMFLLPVYAQFSNSGLPSDNLTNLKKDPNVKPPVPPPFKLEAQKAPLEKPSNGIIPNPTTTPATTSPVETKVVKEGFFAKIISFFKNLFK